MKTTLGPDSIMQQLKMMHKNIEQYKKNSFGILLNKILEVKEIIFARKKQKDTLLNVNSDCFEELKF